MLHNFKGKGFCLFVRFVLRCFEQFGDGRKMEKITGRFLPNKYLTHDFQTLNIYKKNFITAKNE